MGWLTAFPPLLLRSKSCRPGTAYLLEGFLHAGPAATVIFPSKWPGWERRGWRTRASLACWFLIRSAWPGSKYWNLVVGSESSYSHLPYYFWPSATSVSCMNTVRTYLRRWDTDHSPLVSERYCTSLSLKLQSNRHNQLRDPTEMSKLKHTENARAPGQVIIVDQFPNTCISGWRKGDTYKSIYSNWVEYCKEKAANFLTTQFRVNRHAGSSVMLLGTSMI